MSADPLERLFQQIRELPPEKLAVLAEFVAFLRERAERKDVEAAMLLSQEALAECSVAERSQ